MKKLIVLTFVFLLVATSLGVSPSAHNARSTFRNSYAWGGNVPRDRATAWAQAMEDAVNAGQSLGTGLVFHVDSSATGNGEGTSWENAATTIDAGINLCTASRGDLILVAQGHAENMSTATSAVADIAGITIRGVGNGDNKPILTYTAAAGRFVISAASVRVENIRFLASVTSVVSGLPITAAGDEAEIVGCEFYVDAIGTDEFLTAIKVEAGANDVLIDSNVFRMQNGGAVTAVNIAAVSGDVITNNFASGDYSDSVIMGSGISDDVIITGNILINGELQTDGGANAVAAINMTDGTTGYVAENRMIAAVNTALLVAVADDMHFVNNFVTTLDGDEFEGGLRSGGASVAVTPSN